MRERRAHARQRTYLGGAIEFNEGLSVFDCLIRNASHRGVRVNLSETVALPQICNLYVKKTRQRLRVRLAWRSPVACGFEFDGADSNIIPLSSSPLANLLRAWNDQAGGALVEYALIGGLGAILAIYQIRIVGLRLSHVFQTISSALQ